MKIQLAITFLALIILTGCGGSTKTAPPPTAFVTTTTTASAQAPDPVGPLELQAAVMAFADTSNSRFAQIARIIDGIGTPQARLTAARMLVFDISSNVEIAAGPYPGIALLDMVVVTSLRRMVWEDFWIPQVFGKQAESVLESFRVMEKDIWKLASRIMTPEQLDELAKVILDWRKKNRKQVAINYIRFNDFGNLGLKPSMRRLTVPGGLFASVKEATLIAQDMKVSIDRAFYLMSRMQLVISFQVNLAYLEMMFQPEADGIVNASKKMVGLTERYAEIAENLPDRISEEAAGLMGLLFADLAKNRDETISSVLAGMTQWQDQAIKDIMASVSVEREAALQQVIDGVIQQQSELYKQIGKLVDKGGTEFEDTLNHAFLLGVLLILIFFALLSLYRIFIVGRLESPQ